MLPIAQCHAARVRNVRLGTAGSKQRPGARTRPGQRISAPRRAAGPSAPDRPWRRPHSPRLHIEKRTNRPFRSLEGSRAPAQGAPRRGKKGSLFSAIEAEAPPACAPRGLVPRPTGSPRVRTVLRGWTNGSIAALGRHAAAKARAAARSNTRQRSSPKLGAVCAPPRAAAARVPRGAPSHAAGGAELCAAGARRRARHACAWRFEARGIPQGASRCDGCALDLAGAKARDGSAPGRCVPPTHPRAASGGLHGCRVARGEGSRHTCARALVLAGGELLL